MKNFARSYADTGVDTKEEHLAMKIKQSIILYQTYYSFYVPIVVTK
jgi:hypothetical protein